MPHLERHCARCCEVQGAHLLGKMAGDPRKRAGSVRVQKPYQLHVQTDHLSLLQIIPMSHFDRSGLSKTGDKWGYLSPFIPIYPKITTRQARIENRENVFFFRGASILPGLLFLGSSLGGPEMSSCVLVSSYHALAHEKKSSTSIKPSVRNVEVTLTRVIGRHPRRLFALRPAASRRLSLLQICHADAPPTLRALRARLFYPSPQSSQFSPRFPRRPLFPRVRFLTITRVGSGRSLQAERTTPWTQAALSRTKSPLRRVSPPTSSCAYLHPAKPSN